MSEEVALSISYGSSPVLLAVARNRRERNSPPRRDAFSSTHPVYGSEAVTTNRDGETMPSGANSLAKRDRNASLSNVAFTSPFPGGVWRSSTLSVLSSTKVSFVRCEDAVAVPIDAVVLRSGPHGTSVARMDEVTVAEAVKMWASGGGASNVVVRLKAVTFRGTMVSHWSPV